MISFFVTVSQAMATVAANMVHLSGGYAAGFSAPTSSSIQTDFDLDDSAKNWFGMSI